MEPAPHVVTAFGGDSAALTSLAGGAGRSWRAGPIVLKPGADADLVRWLSLLGAALAPSPAFRFATPVASGDGQWVIDGWAAFEWLDGRQLSGDWDMVLQVSAVFHDALARLPTTVAMFPQPSSSPWTFGDRVAWGEEHPPPAHGATRALLDRLTPILAGQWDGQPPQIIHGDIGGNVLFADDGLAPAIIDMSPYWRPAAFADAVVVVDAIAWQGAPLTLAVRFGATRPHGDELLLRAVAFRVATSVAAWPDLPARHDAETDAYRPILTLAGAAG